MLSITFFLSLSYLVNAIKIEGLLLNSWDHVVNQLVNGSLV